MYLLRAKQLGFTMVELEELEEGQVLDCVIESANDQESDSYCQIATQEDFDKF